MLRGKVDISGRRYDFHVAPNFNFHASIGTRYDWQVVQKSNFYASSKCSATFLMGASPLTRGGIPVDPFEDTRGLPRGSLPPLTRFNTQGRWSIDPFENTRVSQEGHYPIDPLEDTRGETVRDGRRHQAIDLLKIQGAFQEETAVDRFLKTQGEGRFVPPVTR
eukprot:5906900-Amphidinium_carterae.1